MDNTIIIKDSSQWTMSTLQEKIDHSPSPGTIVVPPGRYKTGPLKLRSGIRLHLSKGTELIFSDDFSLYPVQKTRWEGTDCHALQPLIFAEDCSDITISGKGTINGNGWKWWHTYSRLRQGDISDEAAQVIRRLSVLNTDIKGGSGGGGKESNFLRPPLLQFKGCKNILLSDITLQDSPFWNTHILYSSYVRIDGVQFINPKKSPNGDGLDIDSSHHVSVDDCFFDVGDDCLCLKSGMDEDGISRGISTEKVTVSNCHMENGHGAVVFGSETSGGIRDVEITGCRFFGTDRGIRMKTRRGRGGSINNILINNTSMHDVTAPLVFNMFYRCGATDENMEYLKSLYKETVNETTPSITNIQIENIIADGIKSSAVFLFGLPESPIGPIRINNYTARTSQESIWEQPAMDLHNIKAKGADILAANTEGLTLKDVYIDNEEPVLQHISQQEVTQ